MTPGTRRLTGYPYPVASSSAAAKFGTGYPLYPLQPNPAAAAKSAGFPYCLLGILLQNAEKEAKKISAHRMGCVAPPTPPGPRLLLQGGRGDGFTRFFKAFPAAAAGGVKRLLPGTI